jgi:hypothetical protein
VALAAKTYEALWKHFVPRDGPAPSVYGEVLRAYARISHEVNVNQMANWGTDHNQSLDFIRTKISDSGELDAPALQALSADLDAVRSAAALKSTSTDLKPVTSRVKQVIVDWCNRKVASLTT